MPKKIVEGECKLCLEEKILIRSHILPMFAYRLLKKNIQKGYVEVDIDTGRAWIGQSGKWENLLCAKCDNNLGRYEHYVKTNFIDKYNYDLVMQDTMIVRTFPNLDYKMFKLFCISILWKMGVASIRGFARVDIHNDLLNKMREMINNENPGEPYEFGCVLITTRNPSLTKNSKQISPPQGMKCYNELNKTETKAILVTYCGFVWMHFLENRSGILPSKMEESLITEDNVLLIGFDDKNIINTDNKDMGIITRMPGVQALLRKKGKK